MDRVTKYATDVVKGRIIAGKKQKQACQRHLDDLKRANSADFPYHFDAEKAHELIDFMELLIIAEGDEPEPLKLKGFQDFCFGSLNGWVSKQGHRRFRTSYIQLARQQGKSIFNGGLSIYYGNFAGYQYPQCYVTATKQDQAKIVLRECIKFIEADEELSETFHVKEYTAKIECLNTRGYIQALGKDTKSIDGFRPYFGSVDEYHAHKDDQIYKLLQSGTKRLKETLISVITTSGLELNTPCYRLYEYCGHLLSGVILDEEQFVFICELDKGDDPYDEKAWPKANPLWDEITLKSLRTFAVKAKAMGGTEEMEFFTKSLNIWVEFGDSNYIDTGKWKECSSERGLQDFIIEYPDAKCWAGLDLSQGGDLTSLALVFVYENDEKEKKYYVFSHSFIPKNKVLEHEKTDKAPYRQWVNNGLLTVTETAGGVKTDYKYIIAYLDNLIKEYGINIQMICYDSYNASTFVSDLEDLGIDSVEIKQSALNLSEPTEDFQLEVEAGNVEYDKRNALLTWSIINAKIIRNAYGSVKIDKAKATKRIDPVDAIIDAWKMAMTTEMVDINKITSDYLDRMGW